MTKRAIRYAILLICLLSTFVHVQFSKAEEPDKVYFIARTNVPLWNIYLQNLASKKTEWLRSNYLSGDNYIATKLSPGTYKFIKYGRYDNQLVLPKTNVQITIFADCTNFYGRLNLYEDGSVMPGKAVVTDAGILNVNELKTLGVRIKSLFAKSALCVSGERDDFRFEWDTIKQYVEEK